MGLVVFALRELLPLGRLFTILEIIVGVAVYVVVALAVKAVSVNDFRAFKRKKKA